MPDTMILDDEDSVEASPEPVRRLCSEIQLFDLCELEKCSYKDAGFCKNEDLLTRFERIADEDATSRVKEVSEETDGEDDEFGLDEDDGQDDFSDEDDIAYKE